MTLANDDFFKWIELHQNEDVDKLLFKYAGDEVLKHAILQIDCRKRAYKKLNDTLKCPKFIFPTRLLAEQCTSDILAEFHASLVPPGIHVLDLTSGLGIDAFHFAKKASSVTCCEIDSFSSSILEENAQSLGFKNITVVNGDCCDFLSDTTQGFDCVFIDPARRGDNGKRLYALSDCAPDIVILQPRIMEIAPLLIVKASPLLDVTKTISQLKNVESIYAVGNARECKELLVVCRQGTTAPPCRRAVTLLGNECISFEFCEQQETAAIAHYATPVSGQILLEPYPSTMKAGPFKYLCQRFNISKLDTNTHLYLSDTVIPDFPGRQYRIIDSVPFNKSGLRKIKNEWSAYDVTTRNFPISAPQLVAKLDVRTGDNIHKLFAATAIGDRMLIMTETIV